MGRVVSSTSEAPSSNGDVPNSIIASAKILTGARIDDPKISGWQQKMWHYYDTIGEFRRGVDWVAAACSQVTLVAAKRENAGDEPVVVTKGESAQLVRQLGGGMGGHAELIQQMVRHLLVVGITYAVGTNQGQSWRICSPEEIRRGSGSTYQVLEEEGQWVDLPPESLVVRIHDPDPRKSYMPTCIAKSAQPILREIELITEHIHSTMINRLAGAGMIILPTEVTFPGSEKAVKSGQDPFVFDLIEVMQTAIQSASSAARVVPIVIKVPGDYVDKVKHITFSTPFDEKTLEQRAHAIERLAVAMYIEEKVLTGGEGLNHWGLWHVDEQTLTMHIKPLMAAMCADLTLGYLHPTIQAITDGGVQSQDADIVWYDASKLQVRPDKSEDTIAAYDRGEADGEALRRETGLSEEDKPTPDELRDWAVKKAIGSGDKDLIVAALEFLGATLNLPAPAPVVAPPAEPQELAPGEPSDEPPSDSPSEPPTPAPPVPGGALAAGLVHACDGLVHRALERAGNRLLQISKMKNQVQCPPAQAHMVVRASAQENLREGVLFQGSWDRVHDVAGRFGLSQIGLQAFLQAHCESLIERQDPYSFEGLTAALEDWWLNQQPSSRAA